MWNRIKNVWLIFLSLTFFSKLLALGNVGGNLFVLLLVIWNGPAHEFSLMGYIWIFIGWLGFVIWLKIEPFFLRLFRIASLKIEAVELNLKESNDKRKK